MNPTFKLPLRLVAVAVGLTCGVSAKAVTFETENISGNFDSTISLGLGVRASTPTCGLVLQGATGPGAPTGCLDPISGLGDQGNLNYARGDLFAGQLKGSHELLLKLPEDIKIFARANWVRDFAASHTSGIVSATTPPGLRDNLAEDARWNAKPVCLGLANSRVGFWICGSVRASKWVSNRHVFALVTK